MCSIGGPPGMLLGTNYITHILSFHFKLEHTCTYKIVCCNIPVYTNCQFVNCYSLFKKNNNNEAQLLVYLKSFLLFSMVELDHQRSAANTLVNKMRLDIFVLFNIFNYCRFSSYSEFAFQCFNSF